MLLRLASTNEERVDLADAPTDIQPFCGRDAELDKLASWLTIDRCKLVGILGIGGIGKTSLAARLSDEGLAGNFDRVICGSDRVVKIWDTKTGNNIQSLTGHTDYVVKLLFIDDRTLLSQSYDTTLRQWDLTTGES